MRCISKSNNRLTEGFFLNLMMEPTTQHATGLSTFFYVCVPFDMGKYLFMRTKLYIIKVFLVVFFSIFTSNFSYEYMNIG